MKSKVQRLVSQLDSIAREEVKRLAGYRCERCGGAGSQIGGERTLAWAHIAGRGKRFVRWGFKAKDGTYCWNAFCLCGGDHMWFDNAENRTETEDFLLLKLGKGKWNELKEQSRITTPWGIYELEKKIQELSTSIPNSSAPVTDESISTR